MSKKKATKKSAHKGHKAQECPNLKQLMDIAMAAAEFAQESFNEGEVQQTPVQQLVVALMQLQSIWDNDNALDLLEEADLADCDALNPEAC